MGLRPTLEPAHKGRQVEGGRLGFWVGPEVAPPQVGSAVVLHPFVSPGAASCLLETPQVH